jgi:hypothetical protein
MDILKRRRTSGLVIGLLTATSLALIPLLGVACSDDEESSSATAAATEESPSATTHPSGDAKVLRQCGCAALGWRTTPAKSI